MKKAFNLIILFAFLNISSQNFNISDDEYREKAKLIWENYVPKSGQAEFVQGELLRALEKLRDESQRNGNINFNKKCHTILIQFLREKLTDKNLFNRETRLQINKDLNRLKKDNQPYTEDDIYNRISDRIIDWFLFYCENIQHSKNSKLKC